MWVLRRIPKEENGADRLSPWRGCLHVDDNNRVWYATSLAQPTLFGSEHDAQRCLETIRCRTQNFLTSEIVVTTYQEVFGKPCENTSYPTWNG